jgi:hypothetical protein
MNRLKSPKCSSAAIACAPYIHTTECGAKAQFYEWSSTERCAWSNGTLNLTLAP